MDIRSISPEDSSKHHRFKAPCGYCYCNLDEDCFHLKSKLMSLSIGSDQDDIVPFQYNYLVGLFTAPDMTQYLAQPGHSDDVPPLPIHLQRLISEASEEVIFQNQVPQVATLPALQRLQRLKDHIWPPSGSDIATLMVMLTELLSDEDEFENILR